MDIRGIELRREVQQALLFRVRHVERGGGRGPGLTDEEQVTPQRGQFAEEKAEIHATLQQFLRQRGNGEAVLSLECVEKALIKLLSGKAEHAAGGGFGQVVAAEGQRLAEQEHAVAHASGGTALTQANGVFSEGVLTLATTSAIQYEQLSAPSRLSELERLASDYSGKAVSVQVSAPERLHKTEAELKKEFASHPVIKSLTETFGASLIRCIPVEHTRS